MLTTPQKKPWSSGWSLTPRSENHKSSSANPRVGDESGLGKEKGVALVEVSPAPPSGAMYGNGGIIAADGGDPEALVSKVAELEKELFEYQYNMGLLIIENKEWTSKYEDLQMAMTEAKDALKREQTAHYVAISDVERREENLRKALGVEKQCVDDLEKTLREMRAEYAEIKFTADSKLAEANALAITIEDKSLEVEARLREAEARLAEASRKSADIERKKQDLDARESAIRRARVSFDSEREAQDSTLCKQREDLREWEKKLQEGEERLYESQKILNQREERVNEVDRRFKQKENDLEEAQKKIEMGNKELKKLEEEITKKFKSLKEKEQDADIIRKRIETKETELHAWEEKLSEREHTELQKLLDQHKSEMDARKQEFDLELQQKSSSFDEELKSRVVEVEKREAEIKHMEEKIAKREEALEKKVGKLKHKETDLDTKSKALKAEEKSLKAEEKQLDSERKQVQSDMEKLICLKEELEQREAELSEQLQKILEEKEQLEVTEEERLNHVRLQSELKLEIEKYRHEKEELMRQADGLKKEREIFEKEWEGLDEKKAEIEKELKNIDDEKDRLEKWRHAEQEQLKNVTLAAETNIQREMEALRLAKESFAAEMEHEKSLLSQKAHSERSAMLNDIELRKRELEIEMQKKMEEMEISLREKERSFEEDRDKELINIAYLKEKAERGMEDMKVETRRVEKQREEVESNRKDLEEQRLEIQKDIEQLVILSGKLKDQREHFLKERECFIAFVEKNEGCQRCGEITREFVISDLQSLHENKGGEILPLPKLPERYMQSGDTGHQINESSPVLDDAGTPNSAGKMSSWLRKCTSKIFLFSPTKKNEKIAMQNLEGEASPVDPEDMEPELENDVPGLASQVVNDSSDIQTVESADDIIREDVEGGQDTSVREEANINDEKQEVETSQLSGLNGDPRPGKKRGRARISRNRTMKEVVKDAEALLGKDGEQNEHEHPNGGAEDSAHLEASQDDLSLLGKENGRKGRKRSHAQTSQTTASLQEVDSEGNSESIAAGTRRKRRQKISQAVEPPAEKRYNLRRPRNVVQGTTGATASKKTTRSKAGQTLSAGVTSGNGEGLNPAQDEDAGETSGGRIMVATTLTETTIVMSEEVNGSPDGHGDYSNVTPGGHAENSVREGREYNDEEEDEDEEALHPGEASIGKKLWTFFTT
ncbi:hypothetical protein V2J09_003517 [Rumex salicifolius]